MLARIKRLWPFVLRRSFDRVVDSAAATLVVEIEQRRALADALIGESAARRHAEAVANNNAEVCLGLRNELAAADELVDIFGGQREQMLGALRAEAAKRKKAEADRDAMGERALEADNDARDAWRKLAKLKAQVRAINTN